MIAIYLKFNNLEPEKQERIINAAFEEFALNGYKKASTNEIIKKAEISKGSLFSYFDSKKKLYLFLLEYMIDLIDKIYCEIDWNERDLLKRISEIGLIKFKIMKRIPQGFNFLKSVGHEDAAEVKNEIKKISKGIITSGFEKIYENIDLTKFRDDIDIPKTMNIIRWTMLSFAEQQSNELNSFENVSMKQIDEWNDYYDVMKCCFYKKEEN